MPQDLVDAAEEVFDMSSYSRGDDRPETKRIFLAAIRKADADANRPNQFFDAEYYRERLQSTGRQPHFENLLLDYLANERDGAPDPHPLFDRDYYLQCNPDLAVLEGKAYRHFVQTGANESRDCHPLVSMHHIGDQCRNLGLSIPTFRQFLEERRFWGLSPNPYFDPDYYTLEMQDPHQCPLRHYVEIGWRRGYNPSRIFNTMHYSRVAGRKRPDWQDPLSHFLISKDYSISPHPLFDPAFYRDLYGDVGMNPYEHYVRFGISEGRSPSPLIDVSEVVRRFPGNVAESVLAAFVDPKEILRHPLVASSKPGRAGKKVPSHERGIQNLVLRDYSLDCEICFVLPFLKRGGGELSASHYVTVAAKAFGPKRVLIIVADEEDIEARDWFPSDVCIITLDEFPRNSDRLAGLRSVLDYISPRRLHIINSSVGWTLICQDGLRLSKCTTLYGNFYAFQYLPNGDTVGFIHNYFERSFVHLSAVFHDNVRVRKDIITRFGVTPLDAERLVVAYNPAPKVDQRAVPLAEFGSVDADVLWAGRLDDEKLPYVLANTARGLPDVIFHVWGCRTVDKGGTPVSFAELPNVRLMGRYRSFRDIVDGYTYRCFMLTSKWEGMPNALLEAVAAGLPVVAPNVGGIAELVVDGVTGHIVENPTDVTSYIFLLRKILTSPLESRLLAKQAQERLQSMFTWDQFERVVSGAYGITDLMQGTGNCPHGERNCSPLQMEHETP